LYGAVFLTGYGTVKKRTISIGETLFDDLDKLLTELPWWMGPPMAGVAYVLLRFAFPALAGVFPHPDVSPVQQGAHNFLDPAVGGLPERLAPWAAGLVLFMWLVSLLRKWKRSVLFHNAADPTYLRGMHWQDFEELVGEYYRRNGFWVEQHGGAMADGGIDLVLKKEDRTTLVQCKHWKARKVGVRPVRAFLGVMNHKNASKGIMVTSGHFTNEARDFAHQNRIELVEGHQLADMIHAVRNTNQASATPQSPFISQ
jgi:restriction system protein